MSSHAVYKRWMQTRNAGLAAAIMGCSILLFLFGLYELLRDETIDEIDDRRIHDCAPLDKHRKCLIKATYSERDAEDLTYSIIRDILDDCYYQSDPAFPVHGMRTGVEHAFAAPSDLVMKGHYDCRVAKITSRSNLKLEIHQKIRKVFPLCRTAQVKYNPGTGSVEFTETPSQSTATNGNDTDTLEDAESLTKTPIRIRPVPVKQVKLIDYLYLANFTGARPIYPEFIFRAGTTGSNGFTIPPICQINLRFSGKMTPTHMLALIDKIANSENYTILRFVVVEDVFTLFLLNTANEECRRRYVNSFCSQVKMYHS